MSSQRRHANPGKRERQARKRHRRALYWEGAAAVPLKVGSKRSRRIWRNFMAVADRRKAPGGEAL
jgi:hypothetical protein